MTLSNVSLYPMHFINNLMPVFPASKGIKRILSFTSVVRLASYVLPFSSFQISSARSQNFDYSSVRNFATNRRMRIERDGTTGTVTFHPNEGSHSATVILMHGLGDSADGLSDLAEEWLRNMPHVKFILPTAEQRRVTLNGGMRMAAW